jgi:sucrose-6-phosphate hydrolase SacC (GH32 family)
MNDPNGPVYDDVHGMYHVFFQDHLAIPPGGGPVWAHVCSRDLVHWARLPVALWNDEAYDSQAIFTGSATVFLDQIVQVYPGICTKDVWPECETGTTLALALPANRSDPFLTNWTKPFELNPIANNTQRDPTSAWRTAHGEWRLSTYDAELFATADFKEWYRVGTARDG